MKTVIGGIPTVLRFTVPGEPVPKGRARHRIVFPKQGKPFVQEYTPPETKAYEERFRLLAKVAVNQAKWTVHPDDRFSVVIRVYRTHEGKGGDLDNVIKSALDSMNHSGVWLDDRYVRGIGAALCDPDPARPRVEVEVRRFKRTPKPKRSKSARAGVAT